MAGREDEILILLVNRRVQLDLIVQELANLGLPFQVSKGAALTEDDAIRAVFCILRIANDIATGAADYPAYRGLLGLLHGVGLTTARAIADACVANNQNFRGLFLLPRPPGWLAGRLGAAVQRIMTVCAIVAAWTTADTVAARTADVGTLLTSQVFHGGGQPTQQRLATWLALAGALPPQMTLDELLQFFHARTESDQEAILRAVVQRLGGHLQGPVATPKEIRVLTMHGAKGLSGSIVFIPSVEQGIIPSFRSLQAAGLVIEQRRLFYVSITRAKAACLISHAALHQGAPAFALSRQAAARLTRSQFLNEMVLPSANRVGGLTPAEAAAIVADANNL
jgi:superfamily I DNA/RNA helicase